jgi:hypothetical protein
MFSNTVAIRTSYTFEEVIYGVKFAPMYTRSIDNAKLLFGQVEFIYGCLLMYNLNLI